MRTVGQVLKEEREKKFYSLEEIEKATKIRKELLEALEGGQYNKLPPATFVQGFIKNYGKFLGLNPEKLLAIFRREFSSMAHPPRILETFSNPIDKTRFRITPTKVLVGLVLCLITVFFVYLWFEYRFLTGGPFLEVSQPVDQFNTASVTLSVTGRTDPEAKVSINNQEIRVDLLGRFAQEIELAENINTVVVNATAKSGKTTKISRTIFLKK
ncbi:MAG: helix-turn-helix domain-containing protein [Candidatus Daviesbacteria bacterium]|nr:helix-turn-helix domain-containing protein [Candidatus Daviesbacteria bacterium]